MGCDQVKFGVIWVGKIDVDTWCWVGLKECLYAEENVIIIIVPVGTVGYTRKIKKILYFVVIYYNYSKVCYVYSKN